MRTLTWRLAIGVALAIFFVVSTHVCANDQGVAPGETVQTNPKDRAVNVAAQVRPRQAPPYPALVSPVDHAVLTSGVVTFVWYMNDHVTPIARFELFLNGEEIFTSIHTVAQSTDDYTLTVQDRLYTLVLRPDKWLNDGNYTWKIRAIDENDLGSDSTTWSFVIDSSPPPLLIVELDGEKVAYSATDDSTLPTEPVDVRHREPLIWGHTEAYSQVEMLVTFADGRTERRKTQADDQGYFWFTTPTLAADVVTVLQFTAIDLAENTTVLDGLRIVYRVPRLRLPLPPLFPDMPVIEIPLELPDIRLPVFPSPAPAAPGEERVVVELPVFVARWWIMAAFVMLAGYVVAMWWLSGTSVGLFFPWAVAFGRRLVWGGRPRHLVRAVPDGMRVPWLAFRLHWLDAKKHLEQRVVVTNAQGLWQWTARPERVLEPVLPVRWWQRPPATVAAPHLDRHPEELSLWQQSFAETTRVDQTDTETVRVWTDLAQSLVVWVVHRYVPPLWMRWIPRAFLLGALAIWTWVLWNTRSQAAAAAWLLVAGLFVRDSILQTPKHWKALWQSLR